MAKRWEVDSPFVRYWTFSGSFEHRVDNTAVVKFDTVSTEWGVSEDGKARKGKGKGERFNHRKTACNQTVVLHVTADINLEAHSSDAWPLWPWIMKGKCITFYHAGGKGMGKDSGIGDTKGKGKAHVKGSGNAYNEDDGESEAEVQAGLQAECEAKGFDNGGKAKGQEEDKGMGKVNKMSESSGYNKGNWEGEGSSEMKVYDQQVDLEDHHTRHVQADRGKKCTD